MKKLFCFTALLTAINSLAQSYETKFIDQSIITIDAECFVIIHDFTKIETDHSISPFHIKSGGLHLSVSGIIDKTSSTKIMLSVFAKELLNNAMMIFVAKDTQHIQYKIEEGGSGSYGGNLNDNDKYIIETRFKIVAPGHPSFILALPLNLHISRSGNTRLAHCFINGKAYLYSAGKKK